MTIHQKQLQKVFCIKYVDSFEYMQNVVIKVFEFARRYDESISLP